MPNPCYIANNGFMSQWCCKCGNRHIWHFEIMPANKLNLEPFIKIDIFQDDKGTMLRKAYNKK